MDEPSLRRENRWVRCSVERRGMLTGRKFGGRRVVLSVCIERRIVRIVRRVASSQRSVGGGSRVNGSESDWLRVCSPQKGRCRLFAHNLFSTACIQEVSIAPQFPSRHVFVHFVVISNWDWIHGLINPRFESSAGERLKIGRAHV